MTVVLKGYIQVPHAELAAVQDALAEHMELTRQEAGCISFNVTQDPEDETKFYVHEVFRNQDDFDFHQKRAQASPWAEASQNVERHYEPLTSE